MKVKDFKFKDYISFGVIAATAFASVNAINAAPKKTKKDAPAAIESNSPYLFEVGKNKVSYDEINRAFKKNFSRKTVELKNASCDSIREFINLYANYKLKVQDADARGFSGDSAVQADIKSNKKIVAESYYFDKTLVEPNVNKLVQMRKSEKQIAIILIQFPQLPSKDTAAAYNRAKLAMDRIKSGEDFASVAKDLSDDKVTSAKGGIIDEYLTSGRMERNLENSMYALKPGEVYPEIVTLPKFGYFIVKLLKDEPRYKVKFSHILVSKEIAAVSNDTTVKLDPEKIAKAKADSLYALITKGANFEKLAKENSDDPASAKNGGRFDDWYSRSTGFAKNGGRVVSEFDEAIFNMKNGEISKPIPTVYGYHLIRRDSSMNVNAEDEREDLRKLYKRAYYEQDKRDHVDELKKKLNFNINQKAYDELLASVDTNRTNIDSLWDAKISDNTKKSVWFSIDGENYTVGAIVDKMNKPGELRGLPTNLEGFNRAINVITDPYAIDYATNELEKTNIEFKELMREFRDGILLFKVEAIEVWDKLKFDTVEAKSYYSENAKSLKTDPTYDISEIYIVNEKNANDIYSKVKSGAMDFDSAAKKYTEKGGMRELAGKLYKLNPKHHKQAQIVEKLNLKEGDISPVQQVDNGYSIFKVVKFNPSRQKTFEESTQEIAPVLQERLQKKLTENWLNSIKNKYKLKFNEIEINKLCNK
jgi:peptidyl-prolyl cis-trans isomerase SurA